MSPNKTNLLLCIEVPLSTFRPNHQISYGDHYVIVIGTWHVYMQNLYSTRFWELDKNLLAIFELHKQKYLLLSEINKRTRDIRGDIAMKVPT